MVKSQHFHRSFCSINKSCHNQSFWDYTAKLGRGVIYSVINITNKVKYKIDNIICAFINVLICPTIVFQTDPGKMAKSQHFHRSFCSSNKSCHNQSFWDNTVKLGRGVIYSVITIKNTVEYEIDDIICAFIDVQICPTIVLGWGKSGQYQIVKWGYSGHLFFSS